jgi:hypothetical protein
MLILGNESFFEKSPVVVVAVAVVFLYRYVIATIIDIIILLP